MAYDFKTENTCQEYFTKAHDMVRKSVRDFIKKEVLPFIDDWEEAGEFPKELYKKAADVGILGMGFPEEYGGTPGDVFFKIAVSEELMRSGSGGFCAGLGSLNIAIPPILALGTEDQKQKFVVPVLAGDKIAALGITEPGGGSDVASLTTTAVKDGDDYIVNGSKTFITSACRADFVTCAVRTGPEGPTASACWSSKPTPRAFPWPTSSKKPAGGQVTPGRSSSTTVGCRHKTSSAKKTRDSTAS